MNARPTLRESSARLHPTAAGRGAAWVALGSGTDPNPTDTCLVLMGGTAYREENMHGCVATPA